jgi:hypothetical protein
LKQPLREYLPHALNMIKKVIYGFATADRKPIKGVENCRQALLQEGSEHLILADQVLRSDHHGAFVDVTAPLEVLLERSHDVHYPKFPMSLCAATTIVKLVMTGIRMVSIPNAIASLHNLEDFDISNNWTMEKISGAVGLLPKLANLDMRGCWPRVMPSTLLRLGTRMQPKQTVIENQVEEDCENVRVFEYEFAEVCFGLQDLGLPALVTLEILDALCPNAVPMHNKWDLITTVKHFRR